MNDRDIDILLQKYLECDSSVEEEIFLKEYFSQNDIPEVLLPYKSFFIYLKEQSEPALNADFDEKILALVSGEGKKTPDKKPLFAQIMKVAAVALICLMMGGIAGYFTNREDKKTIYTDTFSDPKEALRVIQGAVIAVSFNLQEGREESMKAMSKLNKFDEYFKYINNKH